MSELVKDLEGFDCNVCPHKARLKEKGIKTCWEGDGGDCDTYALEWAAARLTELGYIKVVRCGDCWKWGEDACPMATMGDDDDFCPYGEAKEDTNA